jgi:hypothetical protein
MHQIQLASILIQYMINISHKYYMQTTIGSPLQITIHFMHMNNNMKINGFILIASKSHLFIYRTSKIQ